jgi:hypothetical protein
MIDPKLYDLPGLEVGELLDAGGVTTCTLVGHIYRDDDYPRPRGNCFRVHVPGDGEYRIVNFSYENIQEAVRRGVSWPIKVLPVGKGVAVIHDVRIPNEWYDSLWCEVCCPRRFLPAPQRLPQLIDIARGVREESEHYVSFKLGAPRLTLDAPSSSNEV